MRVSRRALVLGLAAGACSRIDAPPSPEALPAGARGAVEVLEWQTAGVSTRAVVLRPRWTAAQRLPVLIALHGRGEAVKAPAAGAMGWPRDYGLVRAIARACAPPLTDADYEGFSVPARLAAENARLAARPFGGLVVLCPHLPDLDPARESAITDLGRFFYEVLLPRAHREAPVVASPEATGIDGVSLGGHIALRVGLSRPDRFGAVGALQASIDAAGVGALVERASAARRIRPALALRLTTSHDDFFAAVNRNLSRSLLAAGVAHDFAEVAGPHDYAFNRGPGALEMLLWHDRVLARA